MLELLALFSTEVGAVEPSVSLAREHWMALLPPESDRADRDRAKLAPGPRVVGRSLTLVPRDGAVEVRGTWRLAAERPGWLQVELARGLVLSRATLDGREAPIRRDGEAATLVAFVDGPAELVVVGEVDGDASRDGGVDLTLLGAPAGEVIVRAEQHPGLEPSLESPDRGVARVGDRFWTGAPALRLSLRPPPAESGGDLVLGAVGVGLTVGDGEATGRARLRWQVARGAIDRLAFTVANVGDDLDLVGDLVASWARSGDRVEVVLREPVRTAVDLEARWTLPVPQATEATLPLPALVPEGVFRTAGSLQVARDGEIEVVPEIRGWEPTSAAGLPAWGRDLVTGTPTAAWRGAERPDGALGLLRFTPVSGPPTLVDVASLTVATSDEGRTLVRALYQVRNDRGAFLRVVAPPGTRILGARVSGETALVSTDAASSADGEAWLIPLDKSVETVEGLLSFPVEVSLLGEGEPWDVVSRRELRLLRVDAPIAVSRTTLVLPPGYRSRLRTGERGTVADFTEGDSITYGFAVGEAQAALADAAFQGAVDAWMRNDFSAVQGQLDALRGMGADNENIRRLQANLDVVEGVDEDAAGGLLERRIKDQAKARASGERVAQEKVLEEAEQALLAGEYEKAEQSYKTALDIGEKLDKLEQSESVELKLENQEITKQVNVARERKKHAEAHSRADVNRRVADEPPKEAPPAAPEESPTVVITAHQLVLGPELLEAEPVVPGPTPPPPPALDGARANGPVTGAASTPATDDADRPAPTREAEEAPRLEVTATALSLVVPALGETVRYQQLLLPADAPQAVTIFARRRKP